MWSEKILNILTYLKITNKEEEKPNSSFYKNEKSKKPEPELFYRHCRVANRIDNEVNFSKPGELKNRLLELMWKYFDGKFSEKTAALGNSALTVKSVEIYGHFFKEDAREGDPIDKKS